MESLATGPKSRALGSGGAFWVWVWLHEGYEFRGTVSSTPELLSHLDVHAQARLLWLTADSGPGFIESVGRHKPYKPRSAERERRLEVGFEVQPPLFSCSSLRQAKASSRIVGLRGSKARSPVHKANLGSSGKKETKSPLNPRP